MVGQFDFVTFSFERRHVPAYDVHQERGARYAATQMSEIEEKGFKGAQSSSSSSTWRRRRHRRRLPSLTGSVPGLHRRLSGTSQISRDTLADVRRETKGGRLLSHASPPAQSERRPARCHPAASWEPRQADSRRRPQIAQVNTARHSHATQAGERAAPKITASSTSIPHQQDPEVRNLLCRRTARMAYVQGCTKVLAAHRKRQFNRFLHLHALGRG
ncbi:hypothetical protein SKAU_G00273140 [Synaphobranchus kaupii]|uniref:Uncharacterized protein n=1 Tax=Synaphobranchus kaupii TaxID=118154 RepID=A0A9Q1F0W2_SYNKA|nr:hypothetical protein SKAU_G00273140 [Synaphobranchus kaupii]